MEKRRKRKLALSRETVRRLAGRDMAGVAAAGTRIPTCNTVDVECTNIPLCNPTRLSLCCP
jgi:hypothetical protein